MKKVFCVIPSYNEEKNIECVIGKVKKYVDRVVVVDDGSSDNSYEIAKSTGVLVVKHIINRGQGAALQTGNELALKEGADIIVHFDADGQFLAEEISEMVGFVRDEECDVVLGSRFLSKRCDMPFVKRNLIMPIARFVNYVLYGVKLSDPQSGFRIMSRDVVKDLYISQNGMAHCSEILSKIVNKYRIKEFPITVIYNDFGQSFGGGIRIIKDIILSKLISSK